MYELRQLRHFLALVEHGNFGRAALALHLSQPALSRSIQALEADLGCTLMIRHPRKISLTAQGEKVLEHARRLVAGSNTLVEAVRQIDNLDAGLLRIGAGPFPAAEMVPRAVARLISRYPKLQVEVVVEQFSALHQRLRDERIELFVADVRELLNETDLEITRLPVHRVVAVCRPGHPLLERESLDFRSAANYPLAGTHLPESVARGIRRDTQRENALSVQCDNVAFLINMVEHSDAICMAPRDALRQALISGRLKELASLSPRIKQHSAYGLVRRKEHGLSPAAEAFAALLCDYREVGEGVRPQPRSKRG
ncbi:LysR family transcriptional regulator [Proteobacteria bacterium 005FR1]|nr:LysR family transcriptional regulator [Proteobacteria bacterium 005FR1]